MKFKIGDRVQIKTWKEMKKEYGLDKDGDITPNDGGCGFVRSMRFLCGAFATVESVNKYGEIKLKDFIPENKSKWKWAFNFDEFMLKPAKDEKKYRVGDKVQYNGSTYEITKEHAYKEDTDKYEIHIMSDGNKTTAVYKRNGEIVSRSESNLHPDDEFNFKTGAAIAFDRVFQEEPKKKKLVLYNTFLGNYGIVGTPTKYKDENGRPLFIGDTVSIERNEIINIQFVVDNGKSQFVYSILESCNDDGTIDRYNVTLVKPFTELVVGDTIGSISVKETEV